MDCCKAHGKVLKEYDPQPRNQDSGIRWFLYRWDDGKIGVRRLIRCELCGRCYLVQAYRLNKFSARKDCLFEDWYEVNSPQQADFLNRTRTGIQLEYERTPVFRCADGVPLSAETKNT